MNGKIRIGIICNGDFRERLTDALADADPNLEFHVRWYAHQDEASGFARELERIVDAILFSGPVPYYISLADRPTAVPSSFVVFDEVSLLTAFFDLAGKGVDLSTISVDTLSQTTVTDVCREIDIDSSGILTMPLKDGDIHEDFASFHVEHYRAGHTTYALTCRSIVKERLEREGIPCYFMFWTKRTILNSLDLLVAQYLQSRYRGSQIAIGLLQMKAPSFDGSISSARRVALEMQRYLLERADVLGVNLLDIGNGLHLFYTTYGALRQHTNDFTTMPDFSPAPDPLYTFHVGIGTGTSASTAEEGARRALHQAERAKAGAAYIVLDGNRMIGPLGRRGGSRLIRVEDPDIRDLARYTGVTAANLARIAEAMQTVGANGYSAVELAEILNATPRTARRVIARLAEMGLATPIGESSPAGHGRPTTLYRIDLSMRQGETL